MIDFKNLKKNRTYYWADYFCGEWSILKIKYLRTGPSSEGQTNLFKVFFPHGPVERLFEESADSGLMFYNFEDARIYIVRTLQKVMTSVLSSIKRIQELSND